MEKISHKKYLEEILYYKKLELEETEVQERIKTAEFNMKKKLLSEQIDSIKVQLQNGND